MMTDAEHLKLSREYWAVRRLEKAAWKLRHEAYISTPGPDEKGDAHHREYLALSRRAGAIARKLMREGE